MLESHCIHQTLIVTLCCELCYCVELVICLRRHWFITWCNLTVFMDALIACKKESHWELGKRYSVCLPLHSRQSFRTTAYEELYTHSHEAITKEEPIFGIKGPTWLSVIPNYSVINGNFVDYMHCVLSGITKMLLKLWFDSEYSSELWN